MKTIFKAGMLILIGQSEEEQAALRAWKSQHEGHVLFIPPKGDVGIALRDLGCSSVACNEPVVVAEDDCETATTPISNLASTPFELDGVQYASAESYWQGLRFDDPELRLALSPLEGAEARRRGRRQPYAESVRDLGQSALVGTWDHWQLMKRACLAKFTQHAAARSALLATSSRPISCRFGDDKHTLPEAIQAEIWMEVRDWLQGPAPAAPFFGNVIDSFAGPYRWLSNFWPIPVVLDGQSYPSVEHAYQAAKTTTEPDRELIARAATPGEAKRLSQEIQIRSDWPERKLHVMGDLLRQKFRNRELAQWLVETRCAEIIEGNTWGDTFWGVCDGEGENPLGRLMMTIRSELRSCD